MSKLLSLKIIDRTAASWESKSNSPEKYSVAVSIYDKGSDMFLEKKYDGALGYSRWVHPFNGKEYWFDGELKKLNEFVMTSVECDVVFE